jgi:hypothetical protein
MSKDYKKLFGSIITAFTLFSLLAVTPLYAAEARNSSLNDSDIESSIEKDYPLLLWNLKETPQVYGVSAKDLTRVKLLSPVRIVTKDISNTDLTNKEALYVLHFPMVNNSGRIFAIYTIIKTDNNVNATMGVDFAPLLEKVKNDGTANVVLIQDENGIFALSEAGKTLPLNSNTHSAKSDILSSVTQMSDCPYVFLSLDETNNTYSIMADQAIEDFSTEEIESDTIVGKNKETFVGAEETTVVDENNTAAIARASGSLYLSNYPIVDQKVNGTQRGLCWAATVASMCRFEKPSSYGTLTAKQVADYMGIGYDSGGTNANAKKALSHYLSSPYSPTTTSVLSDDAIKTVINNADPAYMRNKRKTGFWPWSFDYHAVALTGYSFTSRGSTIQIMDPAYEQFKTATKSGSNWSFAFGDTTFTWQDTVRLLYK